jgi:hypothetical protein
MAVDLRERVYLSQYSSDDSLGLVVHVAGVPANADGAVLGTLQNQGDLTYVFQNRAATNPAAGIYEILLSSGDTAVAGLYSITWTYTVGSVAQTYLGYIEIGPSAPAYDHLDPAMKVLIDDVWLRFSDCFDSPNGGPNLQTYFQTHWSRGRVAQLARIAVGRLNTMAQPFQTYTIESPSEFPLAQWGPLLESMTYVECLRHLIRSYVEQPELTGGQVTRLDRRDYMDRWGIILKDEESVLKGQLDTFKIRNMGFGRPRVLVSGGVYGRYGPTRFAGSVAARPRYWTRFY